MKLNIILILKGFVLGIANVIPGISGGTLAITLGIYEKLIDTISNFTKKIKENAKFILFILIGMIIAILLFSNVVGYCLDNYKLATILFFIGIIAGGMPLLFKKTKGKLNISNILIFIITSSLVMIMTFSSSTENIVSLADISFTKLFILFLCGIIASSAMLLPGISGSFVLMLLGYYRPIINAISELTKFNNLFHNFIVLGVFGVGVIIGIIGAAKLINWLLQKYETKTYYGIIGFVSSSIISIFISTLDKTYSTLEIIIGILLLFVGVFIAQKLGGKNE